MSVTKTVDSEGNEVTTYTGVDLQALKNTLAAKAFGTPQWSQIDGHCRRCNQPFSPDTVFSAAGWRETAISGICEKCFDEMFEE